MHKTDPIHGHLLVSIRQLHKSLQLYFLYLLFCMSREIHKQKIIWYSSAFAFFQLISFEVFSPDFGEG